MLPAAMTSTLPLTEQQLIETRIQTVFAKDWRIDFSRRTSWRLNNPADGSQCASSSAPQVSFDADGRSRSETNANGRTIQTTASLNGSALTIRTQGDRASDFQVTFRPVDNGRGLQVTRRFFSDRINQPIRNPEFLYTYLRCSTVGRLFEREPIPKHHFGKSQRQPAPR